MEVSIAAALTPPFTHKTCLVGSFGAGLGHAPISLLANLAQTSFIKVNAM